MSKFFMVVVSLVILSPIAFFLTKYVPYYIHEWKEPDTVNTLTLSLRDQPPKTSKRLGYLEELTSLPLVGHLFLEEKIAELMKLGRFEDVIEKSGAAIESPLNSRSFSIWYHRALSQCIMKQLDDCEGSLRQLTLFSNKYTEGLVASIYSILEELNQAEGRQGNNKEDKEGQLPLGRISPYKPKSKVVDSYEEL